MVKLNDIQDLIEGKRNKSKPGITVAASIIGAATGAAAGLLLAPRSGRETRAKLKRKVQRGVNEGKDKATETKEAAKEKASQAEQATKQAASKAKQATKSSGSTNRTGKS